MTIKNDDYYLKVTTKNRKCFINFNLIELIKEEKVSF
jgi:hypothetical protein